MKIFLSLSSIFLVLIASAQDFTPSFSVSERSSNPELVDQFAGNTSIGYFAIGKYGEETSFLKLDANMGVVKHVAINKKDYNRKAAGNYAFYAMGQHTWFFTKSYDVKAKSFLVSAKELNKDSLTLSPVNKQISAPEQVMLTSHTGWNVRWAFSPDSKKMLIYTTTVQSKDDQTIYIKILDEQLNMHWEKEVHTGISTGELNIVKATIDNEGRFYLLINQTTFIKHVAKLEYHLLVCRDNGTFSKDVPVELSAHFINDCSFDVAADGNVIIAGTYNLDGDDFIDGTFQLSLDKSGYAPTSYIYPFSDDIVAEFGTTNKDSVRRLEARFPVWEVHATPDAGATLILEHAYAQSEFQTTTIGDVTEVKNVTTQYHMEMLVFHFGKNSLAWQDIIYKHQSTALGHYEHLRMNSFYSGSDTWLLYNEDVADDQNSYEYSSGHMQICKLDSAGKIFIHDLTPALPRETTLLKDYSFQTGENEVLLSCCDNLYLRRVRLLLN
ncbi:MAG TPA: hypothetical protein VL651_01445 [Bacteroidia bacterium]|nr:hypothetical protein [Bacteroidia bacterium]